MKFDLDIDQMLSLFFILSSMFVFRVAWFFKVVYFGAPKNSINSQFAFSFATYFFALAVLQLVLGLAYWFHTYSIRYYVPLFVILGCVYLFKFIFRVSK